MKIEFAFMLLFFSSVITFAFGAIVGYVATQNKDAIINYFKGAKS